MSEPAPAGPESLPTHREEDRGYRPISDYAVIGDLHTAALIAADGSIDWACMPTFDSPAVFLRLLDRNKGGYCSLRIAGLIGGSRRYLDGTNILETTFTSKSGSLVLTDFMPLRPEGGDRQTCGEIVRLLRCTAGYVDVVLDFKATFGFAEQATRPQKPASDVVVFEGEHHHLVVRTPEVVLRGDGIASAAWRIEAGEWRHATLSCQVAGAGLRPLDSQHPQTALQETERYWRDWSARLNYKGDYGDEILRSILALKLLTFAPTGAIVAAPTTSLPEVIGGTRNWDYRLSWVRDSQFVLSAFMHCGYFEEAHRFFRFLKKAAEGPAEQLQILYDLRGKSAGREAELDNLEGYRGSRPVRVGNAADRQNQLDIYGELLNCMSTYCDMAASDAEKRQRAAEVWPMARAFANHVVRHWREPDQGIWESRGAPRHYVHSKGMCWAALDRALRLASLIRTSRETDEWDRERAAIMEDLSTNGFDTKIGAFVQSYGSEVLDAAVLRLPLKGVIDATDPRMRSTVEQLEKRLLKNGLLYRYAGPSGQPQEGAFTTCTLWLINYYVLLGNVERAQELLDHLLSFQNELGLFSEEIDPHTGEQLGNFPQALTHVALVSSIRHLEGGARPGTLQAR